MRKLAPLLLAVVAVAALPAAGDAKSAPHRCRVAKDGHAVKTTRRVLVYQNGDNVIACLRPDGRRYVLGQDDGLYNGVTVDAIAGTKVTYTTTYVPECKADCPPDVTGGSTTHTIDVRTGQET
jgi:hypothetical protein